MSTFGLAACGNPATGGQIIPSSSSPSGAPSSPAVGTTPYKVGLLASLTGPYSNLGIAARDAVQLEAKKLNDHGGIAGHPVDLVIEDDRGDPSQAVTAVKDLIDQKVLAVIGPELGAVALAVLPLEDQAKLPAVSLADDQGQWQPTHPFLFVVAPPPALVAAGLLSYLQQTRVHKIALLRETSAEGIAGAQQLKQQGGTFGVQVILDETYQLTDTDMTRQIDNAKNNAAVEALVVWSASDAAAAVITKEFGQVGLSVPLILTAAQANEAYLQGAGNAANGVTLEASKVAIFKYLLPDDPSYRVLAQFIPAYKAATGRDPDWFAAMGHDAFDALVQAISNAGSLAPDAIVAEFEKTSFDGAAGPFKFSASDHAGVQPGALAMVAVQGGQFVPIKPNCAGCAPTTVTKE